MIARHSMIDIKNVDFSYEEPSILSDINLTIDSGDFIGIIGPNGSGKTTLLKLISGILRPNRGNIFISGQNIKSIPRRKMAQKIAVVPQDTYVAYDYKVKEIVFMGRIPYIHQYKGETLQDYHISRNAMKKTDSLHHAEKGIHQISGGETQRVYIARALAQSPEILLLDEFTSHLDLNYKYEMMEILKNSLKENIKCIVAVFHDLNLASIASDRLILLNKGKIVEMGTAAQVINQENIKKVYHTKPHIIKHPVLSVPQIMI